MRKVVLTLALSAAFGIAHAESGENQLFDCMDAKTFEMNNQCMSDQIGNNIRFRGRIRGPYVRFCERDEAVTPHPTRCAY